MKKRIHIGGVLKHIILIGITYLVCLPFIGMIGTAIKKPGNLTSYVNLFPHSVNEITFQNFVAVIRQPRFMVCLVNSLFVTVLSVIVCILISVSAAFTISRFKGWFSNGYSIMLLVLQMFPAMLLLIPSFVILYRLKLINTRWSLIVSYITNNLSFSILMLKGFFDTIPQDLEQAAMVDGCTRLQAFYKIIIPLSLPGICTVGIFSFIYAWNEYTFASIFIRSEHLFTLPVGFVQGRGGSGSMAMASCFIVTLPLVFFLLFTQKFLVEGMISGSVKG
jgi:ABC-type glycerol-3-phosphate transport system permease component